MKPIYVPRGAAKEYGDYALNIYTGCPHRCYYCFAPQVLHRDRENFHNCVSPRKGIIRELKRQLEQENITEKLIHLCFTCDPYPTGYDTYITREVIRILKECGNHVQILTKGDGTRDFDLLDENDWYGVTISGGGNVSEPGAIATNMRIYTLSAAKSHGIKTWVSFEPVVNANLVLNTIKAIYVFVDKVKIGKLNYHPSNIDWKRFGEQAEAICKELGVDYYIKDSLRKLMK